MNCKTRDANIVKQFAIKNSKQLVEIHKQLIQQQQQESDQYNTQNFLIQNEYYFFKCKALAHNLDKLKLRYQTLKESLEI